MNRQTHLERLLLWARQYDTAAQLHRSARRSVAGGLADPIGRPSANQFQLLQRSDAQVLQTLAGLRAHVGAATGLPAATARLGTAVAEVHRAGGRQPGVVRERDLVTGDVAVSAHRRKRDAVAAAHRSVASDREAA